MAKSPKTSYTTKSDLPRQNDAFQKIRRNGLKTPVGYVCNVVC